MSPNANGGMSSRAISLSFSRPTFEAPLLSAERLRQDPGLSSDGPLRSQAIIYRTFLVLGPATDVPDPASIVTPRARRWRSSLPINTATEKAIPSTFSCSNALVGSEKNSQFSLMGGSMQRN